MELFPVYPLFELEIVMGKGNYVFDKKGLPYLDLYGGHAVISVGHSHPKLVDAMIDQLKHLMFYSNSIQNPLQQELADRLGKISGMEDYQLFLVNSGAEANENALKLAAFHNQRKKVLAFHHSFHGRTSAAVNVTDNPKIQSVINHGINVKFIDFEDFESLEKELSTGQYSALIVEAFQGIGGVYSPSPAFMKAIQELCELYQTIFITDEIQCGLGRTGKFFAFQHYENIQPSIITMAKGLGNGFPIGAVLIHPQFKASYGLLGTTFGGNHLACATAKAVLDIISEEQLIRNAEIMGKLFIERLKDLPGLVEIRGKGLMLGLEFSFPIKELREKLLFDHQIFTGSSSQANTLRILPPLTLKRNDVQFFIDSLKTEVKK